MPSVPKQLRLATSVVPGAPDLVELHFTYGRAGEIGSLRVHADDFADFIDNLRNSFGDMVVTRLETPRRRKPEEDEE
jgi:hypothetical protein